MLEAPDPADAPRFMWPRSLQATSTRRALLLTALGGLLIAGFVTAVPIGAGEPGRLAGHVGSSPIPSTGAKGTDAFNRAASGDCLTWADDTTPDAARIIDCTDDHRFEVAESVDMRTFPGSEYGPDAEPPSAARIEQISHEQCESAVRRYLGPRFDPNSKFAISMLWSGDKAWRKSGQRRMLCGLQLPGAGNRQVAFKGKVVDLDQSKVWPTGTCLGIDSTINQPSDIPAHCAAPHVMEVTGTVNLAEKFPGVLPAEADQDVFIKDSCSRLTDVYLAPVQLRNTTLTLVYNTVSLPSWSAGSRQVACSVGATLDDGGWATLLNSAKGPLLINGQPPIPPPEIPEERLNLPPILLPANTGHATAAEPSAGQRPDSQPSTGQQQGNQHLPRQQQPSGPPQQVHGPAATPPGEPQAPPPPPPPDAEAPLVPPAPWAPPPPPQAPPPPWAPPPPPEPPPGSPPGPVEPAPGG